MAKTTHKKTNTEKFFAFDKVALVIGFIVDTITLISILLSLKVSNGSFVPPTFISPWLALSIWVLGMYIYLALLHSYWQKNLDKRHFQRTFKEFLLRDIVLSFRNAPFSFLGLVAIITLIWIATFDLNIAYIVGIIGFFIIIVFIASIMASSMDFSPEKIQKRTIEENWDFIRKRIKSKLSRKQWISFLDLQDVTVLFGIDEDDMVYIFAKYTSENPTSTAFGEVYRRETNEKINGDYSVLINMKKFNHEKYYYSG